LIYLPTKPELPEQNISKDVRNLVFPWVCRFSDICPRFVLTIRIVNRFRCRGSLSGCHPKLSSRLTDSNPKLRQIPTSKQPTFVARVLTFIADETASAAIRFFQTQSNDRAEVERLIRKDPSPHLARS